MKDVSHDKDTKLEKGTASKKVEVAEQWKTTNKSSEQITAVYVADGDRQRGIASVSCLNRHRLVYFRTHYRLGDQLRPPPPCHLENKWSYRAPRGGVRKLSTRPPQSIHKILRLTSNLESRAGQRSNFYFLYDEA